MKQGFLFFFLFLALLTNTLLPSFNWLNDKHEFDFNIFYCAAQTALAGFDPWSPKEVNAIACPKQTWPYLYPAPFLLPMAGLTFFSKPTALYIWSVFCLGCAVSSLWLLKKWSGVSTASLLAITAIFSPIVLNFKAGQVNIPVLFLITLLIVRGNGAALAVAAAIKMSPAVLIIVLIKNHGWKNLVWFFGTGILLFGLSVLVVPLSYQLRFFTEILPTFSRGFPNLDLPLYLTDNHSLSRLVIGPWPSKVNGILDETGSQVYRILTMLLAAGLLWRTWRDEKSPYITILWVIFMTISPVFAWGAHLVFLLPAIFLVVAAIEKHSLNRILTGLAVSSIIILSLPFDWLRYPGWFFPEIDWLMRDTKLFATLTIGAVCLELHRTQNPPAST